MTTLRGAIYQWLMKIGWRRSRSTVSSELARDLQLPPDLVSQVLEQVIADLNDLARDDEAGDPGPILQQAISKLASHGGYSPFDETALNRCLNGIAEPHLSIIRHYRNGMNQPEIAAKLCMDEESVSRSLVKTYADLRMKMLGERNGEARHALPLHSQPRRQVKQTH